MKKKPKVNKVSESITVDDLPDSTKEALVKFGGRQPTDVLTADIGYTVNRIGQTLTDGEVTAITIEVVRYTLDAANKPDALPDDNTLDLTITQAAQLGVPPADVIDPADGVTVLIAKDSHRTPLPKIEDFLDIPINGKQVKATNYGQLIDNISAQALTLLRTVYPDLAAATEVELEKT